MSFWNFIGGFALFNMLCECLFGKADTSAPKQEPYQNDCCGDYCACDSADADDFHDCTSASLSQPYDFDDYDSDILSDEPDYLSEEPEDF